MPYSNFEPIDQSRATDEQRALVNASFAGDAPEIWRDMAELNFCALRFYSLFEALADDELAGMAVNLVYQFVESFGGTQAYIPSGAKYHQAIKEAQIIKEFDGRNSRQLAKKHSLSDSRIFQIIKADTAKKRASRIPAASPK